MELGPLFLSLQIATLATLVAAFIGVAVSALLANFRFAGRDLVDVIFTAPIVMPPTVLGYYVLVALGRRSFLGHAFESITGTSIVFTKVGAVVAAVIGALPLVVKSVRTALEETDPTLVLAARTLGATPLRAFFTIQLPLAYRAIAAALMLAFARSLGDFGVTLMVAGDIPGETQTASLAIYDAIQGHRERDAAFMVGILTAVVIVLEARMVAREKHGLCLEVAFEVPPGVTVLFGPSAAGKSRTLACIAGLVRPDRGHVALGDDVWFDSDRGAERPIHERRVAFVFQSLALFPHMSAADNVAYGLPRDVPAGERRARAIAMLEKMHVPRLANRMPRTFSGGEAQRVALARAFAMHPRAVLLDEPFSALDVGLKTELLREVGEQLAKDRVPTILVTHQPEDAEILGDRVVFLEKGRVQKTSSMRDSRLR